MKIETLYGRGVEEVKNFFNYLKSLPPSLIFLFGACSVGELRKVWELFKKELPHHEKIGLTVAASIVDGLLKKEGFLISVFKGFEFEVHSSFKDEVEAAKEIGSSLKDKKEGLLLVISDGVKTQGEDFLKRLKKEVPLPLIGGKASTLLSTVETAVFHNENFGQKGIITVYLKLKDFKTKFIFDWEEIGKEFLITRASGNRVYSINHFPAYEFYRHYLGDWVAKKLPFTGIEFPLIFESDGMKIARACVQSHEDGSLSFAGRVPEATYVRLGCGDLSNRRKVLETIRSELGGCEYYFLFPCIARWTFLEEEANLEFALLKGKKSVGFLTFGEFFEDKLLNETLTVLAINRLKNSQSSPSRQEIEVEETPFSAVVHLLSRLSGEYSLLGDAINNSEFGVLILSDVVGDGKKRCIYASKGLKDITGYKPEDFILGKVVHKKIIYFKDLPWLSSVMEQIRSGKLKETVVEYRIITASGQKKWIRSYVKCQDGTLLISILDISSRKQVEFLAVKDPLTQLYNRSYAVDEIKRLSRESKFSALLFLDLDKFKLINDVYGHDVGDEILKEASYRLRESIRDFDVPCRFGGDEFIVILPKLAQTEKEAEERARKIAQRILKRISQPIKVNGKEFVITASIGIAVFGSGALAQDVVKFADLAMYKSKERGRNRITVFSFKLKDEVEELESVERELKREVLEKKFNLVFQPIFSLEGEKLVPYGFEVLTRFTSPTLKSLPVNQLISLLEEEGLILQFTSGVFERVVSLLKEGSSLLKYRFNLNVSCKDILSKDFISMVERLTSEFSEHITVELTENVFAQDFKAVSSVLSFLKSKGFKIAIDDFGTGYSCLAYLQELPIDILKVDRMFIREIDDNKRKRRLVNAIYLLGNSLGMDIVAEGIETEGEFEAVKELGIRKFQGYYFCKPLPLKEVLLKIGEEAL
ncbi:bifunctional diguanylate cyclase/phosphodiesterase [Thermovibrio sp.]